MISVTIIILSLLVLLFAFLYRELCKDMHKMQRDIQKLKKELPRDGIQKLQSDIQKLQKELDEVDVRRYSGQTQLTEWLKAISNKLNPLSYD